MYIKLAHNQIEQDEELLKLKKLASAFASEGTCTNFPGLFCLLTPRQPTSSPL